MNSFIYALRADFVKYFGEFRYYRFNYALGVGMNLLLFVGIVKGVIGSELVAPADFLRVLVSFVIWWYSTGILADMSLYIQEEALYGTLEQVFTTRTPFATFILSKVLAGMLRSSFWIALFVAAVALIFRGQLRWPVLDPTAVLLPALLALASILGLGLILLGLSLLFTRVGAVLALIEYALLFLTGVFFSPSAYPDWLAALVRVLPLTWGIECLRLAIVERTAMAGIIGSRPFFWLIVTAAIYLTAGLIAFRLCLRRAMQTGRLAHY